MKLVTVNVVEYCDGDILAVHSFSDDDEGNKQAGEMFTEIAKENGFSEVDIQIGLEDGYLEHSEGDYQLFLVCSSGQN